MKSIFINTSNQTHITSASALDNVDVDSWMYETMTWYNDEWFAIDNSIIVASHSSLMENSSEILLEGLKDMKESVVNFFKNLYKKIKEMTTKLLMHYRAYIGSFEKFIDKYKTVLSTRNPDFYVTGFVYSFSESVPSTSAVDDIISSYNSEVNTIEALSNEQLLEMRERIANQDRYDKIRGQVLGSSTPISSEDYDAEVFKQYRSDAEEAQEIQVNRNILVAAMQDFKGIKDSQKKVQRDHDQLLLTINSLIKFFEKMPITHVSGSNKEIHLHRIERSKTNTSIRKVEHTPVETKDGINKKLMMYFNMKWAESRELSPIITKAVLGKSNALKENMALCKTIIRKAISAKGDKSS